jgi:hypothetical protein
MLATVQNLLQSTSPLQKKKKRVCGLLLLQISECALLVKCEAPKVQHNLSEKNKLKIGQTLLLYETEQSLNLHNGYMASLTICAIYINC